MNLVLTVEDLIIIIKIIITYIKVAGKSASGNGGARIGQGARTGQLLLSRGIKTSSSPTAAPSPSILFQCPKTQTPSLATTQLRHICTPFSALLPGPAPLDRAHRSTESSVDHYGYDTATPIISPVCVVLAKIGQGTSYSELARNSASLLVVTPSQPLTAKRLRGAATTQALPRRCLCLYDLANGKKSATQRRGWLLPGCAAIDDASEVR
jgi:hypothetical protein